MAWLDWHTGSDTRCDPYQTGGAMRADYILFYKPIIPFAIVEAKDNNHIRHANSNISMNIYTHAVSSKKRRAQQKVVEMILPEGRSAAVAQGVA